MEGKRPLSPRTMVATPLRPEGTREPQEGPLGNRHKSHPPLQAGAEGRNPTPRLRPKSGEPAAKSNGAFSPGSPAVLFSGPFPRVRSSGLEIGFTALDPKSAEQGKAQQVGQRVRC